MAASMASAHGKGRLAHWFPAWLQYDDQVRRLQVGCHRVQAPEACCKRRLLRRGHPRRRKGFQIPFPRVPVPLESHCRAASFGIENTACSGQIEQFIKPDSGIEKLLPIILAQA